MWLRFLQPIGIKVVATIDLEEERRLHRQRLDKKEQEYQERRMEGPSLLPIYRSWATGEPLAWSAPWIHKSLCYQRRTWREHREDRHTTSIVNWVDCGAAWPDGRLKTKLEIESSLDLASKPTGGMDSPAQASYDAGD